MRLGLLYKETFRGSYHLIDNPLLERSCDLHLVVCFRTLRDAGEGLAEVSGTVLLEGLADSSAVQGTLRVRLRREKRIPYDLSFVGNDARAYRLRGQREPHPLRPLEVVTDLRFSLYDSDDREIGRGLSRCDLRADVKRTLASVRLRLGA
ncbi:MAG: hypothetical protein IPG50_29240 [Myxococcales bacterium]|nr:hypothetical protein [Myxococcales bacterium]